MTKPIDFIGRRFGHLTVIAKGSRRRTKKSHWAYWLCRCDCGYEREHNRTSLKNGKSLTCARRNCPFYRKLKQTAAAQYEPGASGIKQIVSFYRKRASKKRPCTLSDDSLKELLGGNCHYCGAIPSNVFNAGTYQEFVYNGIDRVDSNKGYTPENSRSCCKRCNWMKNNPSESDFYAHMQAILDHRAQPFPSSE